MLARYHAGRVLDAGGGIVHPGFIDAHNHIVHNTCRGIFGDGIDPPSAVSFADWKADVTPADEAAATQNAALEMLRMGFTMFVEPGSVFDCDAVAAAVEQVGMRALLAGCYLWDQVEVMQFLGGLDSQALYKRTPPTLDRCLRELGNQLHRNKDPDALVRGYIAVYGLELHRTSLNVPPGRCRMPKASPSISTRPTYQPRRVATRLVSVDRGFPIWCGSVRSGHVPRWCTCTCCAIAISRNLIPHRRLGRMVPGRLSAARHKCRGALPCPRPDRPRRHRRDRHGWRPGLRDRRRRAGRLHGVVQHRQAGYLARSWKCRRLRPRG